MNRPRTKPWLFERMEGDVWCFGILLTTGDVLGVQCIDNYYQDFIDVTLMTENEHIHFQAFGKPVQMAATSRCTCTIRYDQIVAIQELADT